MPLSLPRPPPPSWVLPGTGGGKGDRRNRKDDGDGRGDGALGPWGPPGGPWNSCGSPGVPQRPLGPPGAPGASCPTAPGGASGPMGFGAFCFATQEGRKCSRVSAQHDPGPPEPQTYGPEVPGGPGPFTSRPWKALSVPEALRGREGGRELLVINKDDNLVFGGTFKLQ